jgi:hypothetical protein
MLLNVGLETLIGGLILAVLIAVLTAGAYLWLRRGKSDVMTILVTLILVANLACLVTGAGFIQLRSSSVYVGPRGSGQENRKISAVSRFARPAHLERRAFFPRRAPAKPLVKSESGGIVDKP